MAGQPRNILHRKEIHEGPYMFVVLVIAYFQQVAKISDGLFCNELSREVQSSTDDSQMIKKHVKKNYTLCESELKQLDEKMQLNKENNFEQDFLFIGQRMANCVSDIFVQQYVKLIFSVFRCMNKSQKQIQKIRNQFFQGSDYFSLRYFRELQQVLRQLKKAKQKQTKARKKVLQNKGIIEQVEINERLRLIAKLEKNKKKRKKIWRLISKNDSDISSRFAQLFGQLIISIKEIKDWPQYVKQQRQMIMYLDKIINMITMA